jgi:hypothetical protein
MTQKNLKDYIKLTNAWLVDRLREDFTEEKDERYLDQLDKLWFSLTQEEKDYVNNRLN